MRGKDNKIRYRKFFEYYVDANKTGDFDEEKAAEISGYSPIYVKDILRSLKKLSEGGAALDIIIDKDKNEVKIRRDIRPSRGEKGE